MGNLTYYITRWVTFVVTPFVTVGAVFIATKAKAWFGVELDPVEIAALVLGLVAPIVTWLYNRGKWEITAFLGQKRTAELEELADRAVRGHLATTAEVWLQKQVKEEPGGGSPESPRAPGS